MESSERGLRCPAFAVDFTCASSRDAGRRDELASVVDLSYATGGSSERGLRHPAFAVGPTCAPSHDAGRLDKLASVANISVPPWYSEMGQQRRISRNPSRAVSRTLTCVPGDEVAGRLGESASVANTPDTGNGFKADTRGPFSSPSAGLSGAETDRRRGE